MRWFAYVILLYVATAFQVARLGKISPGTYPQIEYLIILVLFYALYAPEDEAALAAIITGITYDLISTDIIGTQAIPIALLGWLVLRIRMSIFRDFFLSQALVALFAGILLALLSSIFKCWSIPHAARLGFGSLVWQGCANAGYTAIMAVPIIYVLDKLRPILGLESGRKNGYRT
ncbi:MAG: rod shape-determining protein MreD [Phycisphaerae bacterium]